jgi:choline transport protein
MQDDNAPEAKRASEPTTELSATKSQEAPINASGHRQELSQRFNLISLVGIGLVVGNVWPAIGGTILVAIYNGGSPGVLYEFVTVTIFYSAVAASIAELVSAIPSSAGVYHWASVTPGRRWGRVVGFFAGW